MPSSQRVHFRNRLDVELTGTLDLPDRVPRGFALFAHCFTCGRNNLAARRIARTLASHGFGVLRFDFTGLGDSEGDFADSTFSANLGDIEAAVAYLREQHQAPELLIGHSLGGTAILAVAGRVEEARALVTIAAPSSPKHLLRTLDNALDDIERDGEAEVRLGERTFRVGRELVADLQKHSVIEDLAKSGRALLVMHAPGDTEVGIDEATRIFTGARHPKSFVSLDDADHLLSDVADAQYAAGTIAAWAARYLSPVTADPRPDVAGGEVVISEANHRFLREITTDVHQWLADEPRRSGGDDLGPDPYEHLLASLGACTSMTIRMYANRKKWPLTDVFVELRHAREHRRDCETCEEEDSKLEVLYRSIRLEGDLDDAQRERLMQIADRCPVHRTLTGRLEVRTETGAADSDRGQ